MTLGNKLQNELLEIVTAGSGTGSELESYEESKAAISSPLDSVALAPTGPQSVFYIGGHEILTLANLGQYLPPVTNLQDEIQLLSAKVAALEQAVADLKSSAPEEQVIVLRSITREQAKQEILDLFRQGETLFYSDIAQHLRLDLPLVVELCQELRDSEEIEVDADVI